MVFLHYVNMPPFSSTVTERPPNFLQLLYRYRWLNYQFTVGLSLFLILTVGHVCNVKVVVRSDQPIEKYHLTSSLACSFTVFFQLYLSLQSLFQQHGAVFSERALIHPPVHHQTKLNNKTSSSEIELKEIFPQKLLMLSKARKVILYFQLSHGKKQLNANVSVGCVQYTVC